MPFIQLGASQSPPEDSAFLLVHIGRFGGEAVSVSGRIPATDESLINMGPYTFRTSDLHDDIDAAMEAANILRRKYRISIYLRDQRLVAA